MINIATITLENEMDLILAHKRTMKVAVKLGLTVATQTTFATAVSEIARVVIEHTDNGVLSIGLEQNKQRYALKAIITFDHGIHFNQSDEGFYYAQRLVPEFNFIEHADHNVIEMQLGLPRSLKLDAIKVALLKQYFEEEQPINAYDEIKQRNISLKNITTEQQEELRQSRIIDQKKTEFISVASHEFKTPITILKAYTQIARKISGTDNTKLIDILEKVDVQTTKLSKLVQQMLDVSKLENGSLQYHMEMVSLKSFLHETVAMLQLILPDHRLQLQVDTEVRLLIDRVRIEQVFFNILGNAAKYSPKKTLITVTCLEQNGQVEIAVTDQGIGLSQTSLQSVFEKFYRDEAVKKSHPGLGMGLYITSKIVKDHGGNIRAASQSGKGSTFYINLPIEQVA